MSDLIVHMKAEFIFICIDLFIINYIYPFLWGKCTSSGPPSTSQGHALHDPFKFIDLRTINSCISCLLMSFNSPVLPVHHFCVSFFLKAILSIHHRSLAPNVCSMVYISTRTRTCTPPRFQIGSTLDKYLISQLSQLGNLCS